MLHPKRDSADIRVRLKQDTIPIWYDRISCTNIPIDSTKLNTDIMLVSTKVSLCFILLNITKIVKKRHVISKGKGTY